MCELFAVFKGAKYECMHKVSFAYRHYRAEQIFAIYKTNL